MKALVVKLFVKKLFFIIYLGFFFGRWCFPSFRYAFAIFELQRKWSALCSSPPPFPLTPRP